MQLYRRFIRVQTGLWLALAWLACGEQGPVMPETVVEEARLRGVEIFRAGDGDPLGSGLLLNSGGMVLTCDHLLRVSTDPARNRDQEIVVSQDEFSGPATYLRGEPNVDLVLLHWRMPGDAFARYEELDDLLTAHGRWAPRGSLRVGQRAMLVGSPYGLSGSALFGHINHTDRTRTDPLFRDIPMIQTAGLSFPGSSGGAIFLADGRIAGVNRATYGFAPGTGIGLALPAGYVQAFLQSFAEGGR